MTKKERLITTLDAETDPFEYGADFPRPFVWGTYNEQDDYRYFWGEEKQISKQLMEYLETLADGSIVYAHNGGKFDFHFLLEYFDEDIKIINGRIAKCTLFDGRIELRDSYLIIPVALGQFDKIEIDYNKMKKDQREKNKNEIIRYLRKDCTSLFSLVKTFYDRFGLNLTLASTALKELKKTGYDVSNTFDRYDAKFRPFYFGGRVQCFKTGHFKAKDEPMDYADINSAYSYAMKHEHWFDSNHKELLKLPDRENGSWFAKITAKSEGVLPSRCEKSKKLMFTLDDDYKEYYASGWEINKGLEHGKLKIKSVTRAYVPMFLRCFSEYIDKWFAEKAAAKGVDPIAYLFAKLMQNAAYGKFGQDGRKFEDYRLVERGQWPERTKLEIENGADKWRFKSDTDSGMSLFYRPAPTDKFYNVPTAASITAFVRAYLFENILASDDPIYCDTDSIICRKFNGNIGAELGQWEIEAKLHEVFVAQKKMYAAREWVHSDKGPINKTKVATKGVRLSFKEIAGSFGDEITHKKDAPAYSLSKGPRYIQRKINLKDVANNAQPLLR